MEYRIGTKVFGDWKIVNELGEGAYGKVFELEKSNFGIMAKSALKLIRIPKSVSEVREALSEGMDEQSVTSYFKGIVEHFIKEIAIMSELKSHPNIVSCEDYAVQEHEGSIGWDILIRMELLTPMRDYMIQTPITEEKVRKLAIDLCEALVYCQNRGLIHRDIKPGNIFVDSMGRFKLGDFGVARTAEKTMGGLSKQGTESYMAPEVYYVRPYGANVDIYSLGMVLYGLMNANRLPFWPLPPNFVGFADKMNALTMRMEGAELPRPLSGSDEFVEIILKACEHDPKKRYRTAGEMLAALKGAAGAKEELPLSGEDPINDPLREDPTVNPLDDPARGGREEEDPTVNPFDDPVWGGREEEDPTVNPFDDPAWGGKEEEDPTVKPFDDPPNAEKDEPEKPVFEFDLRDVLTDYWKENLPDLWSAKASSKWNAYVAPKIPLQVYSNAIFNIGENEVRKNDIIAILDCTSNLKIPCGEGIIFTEDRMIIKMDSAGTGAKIDPKAVIYYSTLDNMWTGTRKMFFTTIPVLCWRECSNGLSRERVERTYQSSRLQYLNLDNLIKHIKYIKETYV